jgi:AmmeMemoRadiSam system protein B
MEGRFRPSILAGSWYPGSPVQLKKMIENFIGNVPDKLIKDDVYGIISPHAGYMYSGQIAAYGYRQLMGRKYDVVVIFSPMHMSGSGKYNVNTADYYETPLGQVPVCRDMLDTLEKEVKLNFISGDQEHSIEIQLPFLQTVLDEFQIVPIMVGSGDTRDGTELAEIFKGILKNYRALIIASSDLHHLHNYDHVVENDRKVKKVLETFDTKKIRQELAGNDCTVCGKVPIAVVMEITTKMGAKKISVLKMSNSGDITGVRERGEYTVGYMSAVII